jgi:hypothetical protein
VGNTINGPLSIGIQSNGHNSVIASNTISGGNIATGIAWAGSKTIQHNQVNAAIAMNITINANAGSYDPALTNVSLNDFTGYRTAVQMPAAWSCCRPPANDLPMTTPRPKTSTPEKRRRLSPNNGPPRR